MKLLGLFLTTLLLVACNSHSPKEQKPNVIIVFTDDQGYQDLGCYGSPDIKTPYIDQMASEGVRYTDFYVASSVCSPSRAALLTGKIPQNNGVLKVFFQDEVGMDSAQVTIAELLKAKHYNTACFGKWHLGDMDHNLPLNQGFDEYFGIPFSNDMSIGSTHQFAESVRFNNGYTLEKAKEDQLLVYKDREDGKKKYQQGKRDCVPLFEGNRIVEYPAEQSSLTKRYFNRAIDFIKKSENEPFFIYLTPAMPHVPLYASEQFKGKSKRGLYGDVVEEIDHYMGQLLEYLRISGLDKNTLVIYASDNGPWLNKGQDGGSALPLRGGKFTNYEGGVRVPGIFWFPGHIQQSSVSHNIASTIDILPTVAALANIDISDMKIDGQVLPDIIQNAKYAQKEEINLYTKGAVLAGIRIGDWKYLLHSGKQKSSPKDKGELFNLRLDIKEQNNLIESKPEKAKELQNILKEMRK